MSPGTISLPPLLSQIPKGMVVSAVPNVEIGGIAIDSRQVKAGDLFVAHRGSSADGHAFIADAISRGAAAVAGEKDAAGFPQPYVQLQDARRALSWIAAAFYGWPARELTVIGVTGTDGKTTTANLIYQILVTAGVKAGLISTVNAVIGDQVVDTGFHVTTPDAPDVQKYLRSMVDAGLTHAILETTSHGWAQHRVDACEFDIGVVTNITHEHLDEHGSFENYREAKGRLFSALALTADKAHGNPRLAVLNRDDNSFEFLDSLVAVNKVSYGRGAGADIRAAEVSEESAGISFTAEGAGFRVAVKSSLLGSYNVSNCLAALGVTIMGIGVDPSIAARGIARLGGVQGRMERIDMGQDFSAYVDFAHTPNALKVTLETARTILDRSGRQGGHLIAVFGSAGLRDRAKRRMMAEISADLADFTILTAEDPRTESLDAILAEMARAAASRSGREGKSYWRIPDRGEAIKYAIGMAGPGDVVLACGKGHEQSMCFGTTEYPWDDRTAIRAALAERLGIAGPIMPYLPTQDQTEAEWRR